MKEFAAFTGQPITNQDSETVVEIYEIDKATFDKLKKIQQDSETDNTNFVLVKLNIVEVEPEKET